MLICSLVPVGCYKSCVCVSIQLCIWISSAFNCTKNLRKPTKFFFWIFSKKHQWWNSKSDAGHERRNGIHFRGRTEDWWPWIITPEQTVICDCVSTQLNSFLQNYPLHNSNWLKNPLKKGSKKSFCLPKISLLRDHKKLPCRHECYNTTISSA